MAILDKLMEKKDLDAYINLRIEFLNSIEDEELKKLPEKNRGFIQERFKGRRIELKQLLVLLKEDKIKCMSKKYFEKINDINDEHIDD